MDRTKIEWADATWNPVTGCEHGCGYCYARGIANRFGGWTTSGTKTTEPYPGVELDKPLKLQRKDGKVVDAPFPFGFKPTLHRYRMGDPQKWKGPRTVFVCSMADLFGEWVPEKWIREVFDACLAAPQHRYMFLTKNPQRYIELADKDLLPMEKDFWYGTTVTNEETAFFIAETYKCFLSIEPMLSQFTPQEGNAPGSTFALLDLIIMGAQTGPGSKDHQPKREWIDTITMEADRCGIPVFMKNSLLPIVGEENMRYDLPWKGEKA